MSILEADSHNFGVKTHLVGNTVFKGRNIFSEWLFLSNDSPVRKILKDYKIAAEEILISLDFGNVDNDISLKYRKVSFAKIEERKSKLTNNEIKSIGSLIALAQWFGLGDLHIDNIIFGADENGRLVCCPIDIECLFELHILPTQSLLIPSITNDKDNCGLSEILSHMEIFLDEKSPLYILEGYIETFEVLEKVNQEIYGSISRLWELPNVISRVVFRDTKDYKHALESNEIDSFYRDEKFQLLNGDIPYFFKFLGDSKVYFWKNNLNYTESSIKLGQFEKLEGLLPNITKDFYFNREKLFNRKVGISQLARIFDFNKNKKFKIINDLLELDYQEEYILIKSSVGNIKCLR